MAIAELSSQRATSGNNDAVDSDALAFPGNVTAGSLLVVAGSAWGSSAAPTSIGVTDTRSTPYTVVLGTIPSGLTWRTFIAYGIAPSAGACTVTVNPSGSSSSFSFSMTEFTGVAATPADVNGGTSTGTSFSPADDITTGVADALLIGVMSHDGATQTITPGGTYTQIAENETNSGNQCHNAVFRLVTTATTYTVGWTLGANTGPWAAQTHSFKPATGAAPVSLIWTPRPLTALIGR